MVHGLLPTILVGVLGALIGEVIRIAPALRLGTLPKGPEIVASVAPGRSVLDYLAGRF